MKNVLLILIPFSFICNNVFAQEQQLASEKIYAEIVKNDLLKNKLLYEAFFKTQTDTFHCLQFSHFDNNIVADFQKNDSTLKDDKASFDYADSLWKENVKKDKDYRRLDKE